MDPVRNPYAPGAGQRPPGVGRPRRRAARRSTSCWSGSPAAGRSARSCSPACAASARPCCSTQPRGAAVRRGWGTGKLEARPDQALRRPLSAALHRRVRELSGIPDEDESTHVLGVLQSFAQRDDARRRGAQAAGRRGWHPGHRRPGGPRPGRLRRHRDRPGRAAHRPRRARRRPGRGIALFIDEMQDLGPATSPRCARPATRSASRAAADRRRRRACRTCRPFCRRASPTPSGCSATSASTGSTATPPTSRCGCRPGRGRRLRRRRARGDVRRDRRLPVLHPGLRQGRLGPRTALADHRRRRRRRRARGRSRARGRLLRIPVRAGHAGRAGVPPGDGRRCVIDERIRPTSVPTADVADVAREKPQSLSPARDALLKKGLIYSGERGRIAFTVPHFGRYLQQQDA